ncbi:hypothetical protein [Jeotgalicoccus sp. WY2]|uniref:hypothetical protein n=1 Tax=Jeotgalicoccus sp. WY2 TaxID=2708346 RepID=UPI001BD4A3B4|nr:hypothetical protein [Jeotgalicoccus sp. WY2]
MPGAPGNSNAKNPLPVLRGLSNKGSFENGGIISSHGYYEGAEGNKPEMVIPLTNKSRAIGLMFQAMSLMCVVGTISSRILLLVIRFSKH